VTADHVPRLHPGEAARLARLDVAVSDDGYVGPPGGEYGLQVSRSIGDFRSGERREGRREEQGVREGGGKRGVCAQVRESAHVLLPCGYSAGIAWRLTLVLGLVASRLCWHVTWFHPKTCSLAPSACMITNTTA
jgi:hypothetical protein